MNFFTLMRAARFPLMAEEGGTPSGGGGGDTFLSGAGSDPAPVTPAATTTDALAEINKPAKTVGELAAEAEAAKNETPEAKTAREAAEKEAKEKADAVPENYEAFKVQEGLEMDAEVLAEFHGLAKELGLSQEKAQKLIDLQSKLALSEDTARQQMVDKALADQAKAWTDQIKNDPELGGAKFDATLQTAHKAMQAFGSPELRQLLNESGMGNNPEFVRLFHKVGLAISEDHIVIPGSDASEATEQSAAKVMFGDVFKDKS